MTSIDIKEGPPRSTMAGFNLGMRLALPVIPGMVAFGLAVGATAARKGFSFVDSLLMNVFVYAGMSQLVAMEAWPERITLGALAALAVLMVTINARMLLMSAALYPWLGATPPWRIYPTLHLLTDPSWLISMRYRAEGGSDAGVLLGSSVLLAFAWIAATCIGHVGGMLIADPRRYGIDLVMPIFFAAMLIPLWHGKRRAVAWIIAGAVAVAVHQLAGGWWFIVAGAIAGSVGDSLMTPIEGADFGILAAIAAMAAATYAMRAGGCFWMMNHVPPSARLRRMLEALPGSVIVATVLPIIVRDGITAMLAIGAAVMVMLLTRRDILAVIAGMAVAAAIRATDWLG